MFSWLGKRLCGLSFDLYWGLMLVLYIKRFVMFARSCLYAQALFLFVQNCIGAWLTCFFAVCSTATRFLLLEHVLRWTNCADFWMHLSEFKFSACILRAQYSLKLEQTTESNESWTHVNILTHGSMLNVASAFGGVFGLYGFVKCCSELSIIVHCYSVLLNAGQLCLWFSRGVQCCSLLLCVVVCCGVQLNVWSCSVLSDGVQCCSDLLIAVQYCQLFVWMMMLLINSWYLLLRIVHCWSILLNYFQYW